MKGAHIGTYSHEANNPKGNRKQKVNVESMAAPVGNQNARNAKRWQSAITRALARASEGRGVEAGLDKLADKLITAALMGEQWALKEVGERLDGKAAQVIAGDDDLPPVQVSKVERVILRANATDPNG
jgi:hypothetical protein